MQLSVLAKPQLEEESCRGAPASMGQCSCYFERVESPIMPLETDAVLTTAWNRNWWKVAFFLALFAFEVAREWIVIANAASIGGGTIFRVSAVGDHATANGEWIRVDGGEPIKRNAVNIVCQRGWGGCMEIQAELLGQSIEIWPTFYAAEWVSEGLLTYSKNDAECVRYGVTIDARQHRVTSSRQLREDAPEKCRKLEERIAMELADGIRHTSTVDRGLYDGHFLPVIGSIVWLMDKL